MLIFKHIVQKLSASPFFLRMFQFIKFLLEEEKKYYQKKFNKLLKRSRMEFQMSYRNAASKLILFIKIYKAI